MAIIRQWNGIGVTDGNLTTATAGVGDNAFNAVNATPTTVGEWINKADGVQHRWEWSGLNQGAWQIRFYFQQRSAPAGTSPILQMRNSDTNLVFAITINTSLQLSFRDSSNTAISNSTALTLNNTYRIDVWKAAGNTTAQIRVTTHNGTLYHSASISTGSTSNIGYVNFGQNSGTNAGHQRFGWMAFGNVNAELGEYVAPEGEFDVANTVYLNDSTVTSHAVPLPSTQWGDQLLMAIRAGSTQTFATPAGWTLLGSRNSSGTTYLFHRQASGTEGATQTVVAGGVIRAVAQVYRVRNAQAVEATFANTDTSDPPSLTPSWGSARNLWIAGTSNRRSDSNVSAGPSNFNRFRTYANASSTETTRARISLAERLTTIGTLNPPAFTTTGTIDSPHAFTIAFRHGTPEAPPPSSTTPFYRWVGGERVPVYLVGRYEQ